MVNVSEHSALEVLRRFYVLLSYLLTYFLPVNVTHGRSMKSDYAAPE